MKYAFLLLLCIASSFGLAQDHGFPFGQITYKQFEQPVLARDSASKAIIIKEFGEAYVSNENKLIFEHHYIIKILKQAGVDEANIEIPIYKSDGKTETLLQVKAASYNIESNGIQPSPFNSKSVFTENRSTYVDLKKFTLPNVRVGSIIEVFYSVETPSPFFVRNFKQWNFQSHLPKVESEYWATIPGNYNYNMSLKGFLKLTKNENSLVENCFDLGGGARADCARYKYGMKNIPAFIEEEYMTASSNFIASINFELLEIRHFTGKVDKVTNEWKDADAEMKKAHFGPELKKGKEIFQKIEPQLIGITDSLSKAKKIYDFIKGWYRWNGYYGKYSDIKKAFDAKKGDIGDINVSLIATLRYAGLDVESLLLSTRENGSVTELWPVLSDFNYVVAKLNIGPKVFLLDASDSFLPFGMLPERCLNGKGRVFSEKKPSYWYDLKPNDKYKLVSMLNLTLQPTGVFTGTVEHMYTGYRAFEKRKHMASFASHEEYLDDLKKSSGMTINKYEATGKDDFGSALTEKFEVELEGSGDLGNNNLLLNPFFTGKMKRNPFQSTSRLFPVDYGAPLETTMILNLTYPADMKLESMPDKAAFTIPNSGGRFLYDLTSTENKVTVNYSFAINKTVFTSAEYQYLKEFYNRVIESQNQDLLFMKKK